MALPPQAAMAVVAAAAAALSPPFSEATRRRSRVRRTAQVLGPPYIFLFVEGRGLTFYVFSVIRVLRFL